MLIQSKFASTCPYCFKHINIGDTVEWELGKPAVHGRCVVERRRELERKLLDKAVRPVIYKGESVYSVFVYKDGYAIEYGLYKNKSTCGICTGECRVLKGKDALSFLNNHHK